MEYFELCVSPNGVDHILAFWMVIRGLRQPSLDEAEAFLKWYGDIEDRDHVIQLTPISEVDARESYDFSKEETWPVFGKGNGVRCTRKDCEFWLAGACSYGGEAINITEHGCESYEPVPRTVREDIESYMLFEEETSLCYPFARFFKELTHNDLRKIEEACHGCGDSEVVHQAVLLVVGPSKAAAVKAGGKPSKRASVKKVQKTAAL